MTYYKIERPGYRYDYVEAFATKRNDDGTYTLLREEGELVATYSEGQWLSVKVVDAEEYERLGKPLGHIKMPNPTSEPVSKLPDVMVRENDARSWIDRLLRR